MLRFLGLFNKEIAATVEMMFLWTAPYVVDTSKAEKAFGLKPTPTKVAIKETLEWCKENVKK
jgi:nucleoside-diphosphate-sugar epimerase